MNRNLFVLLVLSLCGLSHVQAGLPGTIHTFVGGTNHQNFIFTSLQGLIAKESPELYLGDDLWLDEIRAKYPEVVIERHSLSWFLFYYRDQIDGYILCDDASQHVATSLAGFYNAVTVPVAAESQAQGAGLTKVLDVRGLTEQWVWETYGDQFNRQHLFHQFRDGRYHLRDFCIYTGGFMFYDDTESFWPAYYGVQDSVTQVFGWGPSEQQFFSRASVNGLTGSAADWLTNASVLSQWLVPVEQQQTHTPVDVETRLGKHYVSFLLTDGDNLCFLNGNYNQPFWYGSDHRGDFSMNWDMGANFVDINPIGVNFYYDRAATGQNRDYFICSHGPGTIYNSEFSDISSFVPVCSAAMAKSDHRILAVLDNAFDAASLNPLLEDPQIMGIVFKSNWDAYKALNGQIHWHQGKPCVTVKYSLWKGFDSPSNLVSLLNSAPRDPENDLNSYSVVIVHAWTIAWEGDPMSNVAWIVDRLDGGVAVVPLDEMMINLRRHFGSPVEPDVDCNSNGVSDSFEVQRTYELYSASSGSIYSLNGSAELLDDAVRLTPEENGQIGSLVFSEIVEGRWPALHASFDFKITDKNGADGFSFALLDAQRYSDSTLFGEMGPGEGSFVVEFDTHANEGETGNHLELCVDGHTVDVYQPSFPMEDGEWHRASIEIQDGMISVKIRDAAGVFETAFESVAYPLDAVYARTRFGFGARTGGLNNEHWIDNIEIRVTTLEDANANGILDACEEGLDLDGDGDLDLEDVELFVSCVSGPGVEYVPGCESSDLDRDEDVDLADFKILLESYNQ